MSRGRGQDFKVTIVSARDVRASDPLGGKSDPYCVCEVAGRRNQKKQKTPTVNNTKNPKWNYTFEVKDCTGEDDLRFTVYDSDFGSRDDLVGAATLPAHQYLPQGYDGELRLGGSGTNGASTFLKVRVVPAEEEDTAAGRPGGSPRPGSPRAGSGTGSAAGRLGGSPGSSPRGGNAGGRPPIWTPSLPSRRPAGSTVADFKVSVVSARNVRLADPMGNQSDLFCVCEVAGRRSEKKQKTRIVTDTTNPTWYFTYEVKNCTGVEDLKFTVYDSDKSTVASPGRESAGDIVGSVTMPASLYFPEGFNGELKLDDRKAKSDAFLKVRVVPAEDGREAGLRSASPRQGDFAASSARSGGLSPRRGLSPERLGGGIVADGTLVLEGEPSRRPQRAHGIERSLDEGVEQAEKLEERARKLQEHFEQAQHCMASINGLCEEADACIRKSQTTLNKTAKKIHDLTKRASSLNLGQDSHHVLEDFGEAVHQPEIGSRRGKVTRHAAAAAPQLR